MLVQSFSGIRGVYGKTLTKDVARRYAYLYRKLVKHGAKKEPLIVIGSDTRASCPELKKAIIDCFVNVIDVGIMPTPAIEFAVRDYKADGGVIITASHNEPDWNGFKLLDNDGAVLRVKDAEKLIKDYSRIKDMPEQEFLSNHLYKGNELKIKKILGKQADLMYRYAGYLEKVIGKEHIRKISDAKLKVLLDPNGGAGIIAKDILDSFGIENAAINNLPGDFKRVIEPTRESLSNLSGLAKKHKADLAAGFDCDADRLKIALPDGTYVSGQYLLALAVEDYLLNFKHPKKAVIVTNDATSGVVKEIVEKFGAGIKEVEVGEINVVDEMLKNKSMLGGEGSNGGVILAPNRCRDGILTLLMIMNIMASKKEPLKDVIKELPKYSTKKKKIKIDPGKLAAIKKKIKNYYEKKECSISDSTDLFGTLKVWFDDGKAWVFFRTSRTEHSMFRIMADSPSEDLSVRLLDEAVKILNP